MSFSWTPRHLPVRSVQMAGLMVVGCRSALDASLLEFSLDRVIDHVHVNSTMRESVVLLHLGECYFSGVN